MATELESKAFGLGRCRAQDGAEYAAVRAEGRVAALHDVWPGAPATLGEVFSGWRESEPALAAAVTAYDFASAPAESEVAVLAPLTTPQIFQSGANYRTHVVDLNVAAAAKAGETDLEKVRADSLEQMDRRIADGVPYVFLGLPSSICGPYDDVVLPGTGKLHDWELELAAVIGLEAHHVRREDALDYVAGYVIVNDLTTRDRVFRPDMPSLGTDWLASKNAPTFLPLGPWIVPARFVPDPQDVQITLRLNGEAKQDESSADMIFDVARLIEFVSTITPLQPGDLLLTGSPAGNGAHYDRYLRQGDVMEATITAPPVPGSSDRVDLGVQRNRCVLP